ncbi:hypothetical protein [Mycobacteroides immunogenum]|uniref:Uncharacterized protein n=1 Tax=Mycobacteroides immunogenum TaxID=83262 RepID=A0A7V8LJF8_9MYCO|nr:hypothetical protein [Mycobacteroides immunogenum]AMT71949.1 hypothetical protein ABG82_18280 [Mycobacteroides immunogenum]ANO05081.1 hypothetical protein BAB75_18565 [Mycobacteroides immunogenum]KIU40245.1 hypothetical protein TL11_13400 [Mycobacteroides immunogenum]KPG02845.1 hypothetical protein AN909_26430 [Mycobacteroides immunogenum]KPG02933.1 hypothetical protein AN908_26880 [Mycobacteroides immunogenum]
MTEIDQLVAIIEDSGDEIRHGEIDGFVHVATIRHEDRRWSYTSEEIVRAPSGRLYAFLNENGLTERQDDGYGPEFHDYTVYEVEAVTEFVERTRYVKVEQPTDAEAEA